MGLLKLAKTRGAET